MSRILLVRHGNTELNTARRFMGHSDIDLSPSGFSQVQRLRDRLAREQIDAVYSSDLKRAAVTAQTIASPHQLAIETCPELREINYGQAEGLTFRQIQGNYPAVARMCIDWDLLLRFPSGESIDELKTRLKIFLTKLSRYSAEDTILIVSHGGPLRVMVCLLLGIDLKHWGQINIDLASLSIIHTYPNLAILNLLNDTSHLR